MSEYASKSRKEKTQIPIAQLRGESTRNGFYLEDNRPKSLVQRKQIELIENELPQNVHINDDEALEKEADAMGEKAFQMKETNDSVAQKMSNTKQGFKSINDLSQAQTSHLSIKTNLIQRKRKDVKRYIRDNDLDISSKYESIRAYCLNPGNPENIRLDLLNEWNKNQSSQYRILMDEFRNENRRPLRKDLVNTWSGKEEADKKPTELFAKEYSDSQNGEAMLMGNVAALGSDSAEYGSPLQELINERLTNDELPPIFMTGLLYNLAQDWSPELNDQFIQGIVENRIPVLLAHGGLIRKLEGDNPKKEIDNRVRIRAKSDKESYGTWEEVQSLLKMGYNWNAETRRLEPGNE